MLIGPDHTPLASGGHNWENQLVDGVWTYDLQDVRAGLQGCYANLAREVQAVYGLPLETVGSIGISAMMHGYLPFDAEGRQLAAFRTWRKALKSGDCCGHGGCNGDCAHCGAACGKHKTQKR